MNDTKLKQLYETFLNAKQGKGAPKFEDLSRVQYEVIKAGAERYEQWLAKLRLAIYGNCELPTIQQLHDGLVEDIAEAQKKVAEETKVAEEIK